MLEFINNNGVLFSGIFSILGVLITVIVTIIIDNRKSNVETVKSLRQKLENTNTELETIKAELLKLQSIEKAESTLDKTHGSIYYENFPSGKSRAICGFCWEKERIKIPLVVDIHYEQYTKDAYYDGYCHSCKTHCIENIEPSISTSSPEDFDIEGELPF